MRRGGVMSAQSTTSAIELTYYGQKAIHTRSGERYRDSFIDRREINACRFDRVGVGMKTRSGVSKVMNVWGALIVAWFVALIVLAVVARYASNTVLLLLPLIPAFGVALIVAGLLDFFP